MNKKIRFALEMKNGVTVRTIEDLVDNFSFEKILEYYHNGKLITWLEDRYYNDLVEQLELLDNNDANLGTQIAKILGVTEKQLEDDIETLTEHNLKLSRLRDYSDEQEYIDNIDNMAFDQDDIYDLLDEGKEIIYLCGDRFTIPLGKQNITYIGVNNPVVSFRTDKEVNFREKNITFIGIEYEAEYKKIVATSRPIERKLISVKPLVKKYCKHYDGISNYGIIFDIEDHEYNGKNVQKGDTIYEFTNYKMIQYRAQNLGSRQPSGCDVEINICPSMTIQAEMNGKVYFFTNHADYDNTYIGVITTENDTKEDALKWFKEHRDYLKFYKYEDPERYVGYMNY